MHYAYILGRTLQPHCLRSFLPPHFPQSQIHEITISIVINGKLIITMPILNRRLSQFWIWCLEVWQLVGFFFSQVTGHHTLITTPFCEIQHKNNPLNLQRQPLNIPGVCAIRFCLQCVHVTTLAKNQKLFTSTHNNILKHCPFKTTNFHF